jgi:hypothetical protein
MVTAARRLNVFASCLRGITADVIIAEGEGIDLAELAVKAELSAASAGYCLEAFRVVVQALREAKLLPARQAPEKAPAAPEARVQAEQAA